MTLFRKVVTADDKAAPFNGNAAVVNLEWGLPADLDLGAVLVEGPANAPRLLYYDDRGCRSNHPYIHLGSDAQGDGRAKFRKEHLVITNASHNGRIDLMIWDHEAVDQGRPAEFAARVDDLSLTVVDKNNLTYVVQLRPHENSNCIHAIAIEDGNVSVVDRACLISSGEGQASEIIAAAVGAAEIAV